MKEKGRPESQPFLDFITPRRRETAVAASLDSGVCGKTQWSKTHD